MLLLLCKRDGWILERKHIASTSGIFNRLHAEQEPQHNVGRDHCGHGEGDADTGNDRDHGDNIGNVINEGRDQHGGHIVNESIDDSGEQRKADSS